MANRDLTAKCGHYSQPTDRSGFMKAKMLYSHAMPEPGKIIHVVAESILVTTPDLDAPGPTIVYVNPAFERMTGWSSEEVVGQSPRMFQGPATEHQVFSDLRAKLLAGQAWHGMTINYRKDGSPFSMEWSITPLCDEAGDLIHCVAVQRDVSARVEAERQIALSRNQAELAERRRLNLSRYVSPRLAEMLSKRDAPLGQVRRQDVAVVIIDIVGFTGISEAMPPERVVALLRSFYRRLAKVIFSYEGSIEHFAGDSLMAVFGVPESTGRDATNAVRSAMEIRRELILWNEKRINAGRNEIFVGISAHFGSAVLGDIGTQESMSFTVIGDTVNTASRIQELCRHLHKELLVSAQILDKARMESIDPKINHKYFRDAGIHKVRGRLMPIEVFTPV